MNLYKHTVLLLLIALGTCQAFGQVMNFTIDVDLSNAPENSMVFLNHIDSGSGKSVTDSTLLVNGKAKFSGSTIHSQKAILFLGLKSNGVDAEKSKDRLVVYLEKGHIKVSGRDMIKTAVIAGTTLNNDAQSFTELRRSNKLKEADLFKRYNVTDPEDTASIAKLNRDADQYMIDKVKSEEDFFNSHLNSPIALEWLKVSINTVQETKKATEFFSRMGKEVRESFSGKKYATELAAARSAELGSLAPDFTSRTRDGREIALSEFRGKYVLLDFWASWCTPCRAENPNVLKAYQKYKDHNFTVLAYSIDDLRERWEKAIVDDHLPWTQLSDLKSWNSEVSKLFGVTAIPANFLIDPNGKIVARDLRGADLDAALEKMIK